MERLPNREGVFREFTRPTALAIGQGVADSAVAPVEIPSMFAARNAKPNSADGTDGNSKLAATGVVNSFCGR
jgi:hypothetical protein